MWLKLQTTIKTIISESLANHRPLAEHDFSWPMFFPLSSVRWRLAFGVTAATTGKETVFGPAMAPWCGRRRGRSRRGGGSSWLRCATSQAAGYTDTREGDMVTILTSYITTTVITVSLPSKISIINCFEG